MINFQDFGFEDNDRYSEYLKRCIQIPWNLSPLILLNDAKRFDLKRGYAADLCWHKRILDDGLEYWNPPAGDWDEIDWQKVFAAHVPAGTNFRNIPEYLARLWKQQLGDSIDVTEDRDMWDYILHIDRLENLEGRKFKNFRKDRDAFEKNYEYEVEELTPKIFNELREFQAAAEKDLQSRVTKLQDAIEDDAAFQFALNHWDELKSLFGFVVRVDGQIVAYSICEQIAEMHSLGLFSKVNYDFKGVNQFVYWYNAKINLERGNLTQNIMDDVGEDNLRFFKEHLYPLVMLKKFIVTYVPVEKIRDVKISSVRNENNLTLKISGKLNTDAANSAKDEILSKLDDVKNLTFDLKGLAYISSAGLRILIAAFKKVKAQGGTMTIKNVGENVKEVLKMTGFAQIFNVED